MFLSKHTSLRASTITGQFARKLGQLFNCPSCPKMWGIRTWEEEVKAQVEPGFRFRREAPSDILRGRERLVCSERWVVPSAWPFPGSQKPHLWCPVTPAPEIMKMSCSRRMTVRQRREALRVQRMQDRRLRTRAQLSKQKQLSVYPDSRSTGNDPLDPRIYHQLSGKPSLIPHLESQGQK